MTSDPENEPKAPPAGLLDSVKRMARTAAAIVHNRVELLAVEIQEEGARFVGLLLLVGAVIVCSGLGLIMVTVTILCAVSDEHRVMAALIIAVTCLLGAVASAIGLHYRLKNWSAFSGTRDELRKDREWLQPNDPKS